MNILFVCTGNTCRSPIAQGLAKHLLSENYRILSSGIDAYDGQAVSEKADLMFHYTIAVATHNKITIRLMDTISDNLHHLIHATRPKLYEGKYTPELLYREHERIYDAIKNRDVKEARKQMLRHLNGVEEEIIKGL
jgi:GntR family transcriptional repressor for pyruvate dehydrogenase complex